MLHHERHDPVCYSLERGAPVPAVDAALRAAFAVRRARQAQKRWAAVPLRRRLAIVRALRGRIAGWSTALACAVERPPAETLAAEVMPLAEACRFLERRAPALLRPRRLGGRPPLWLWGTRVELRRDPYGVVLVVGPANYPLLLPGVQALQALVAGNAVVVKPGHGGRPAAETLAALCAASGLDPDLFAVLDESVDAARASLEAGVDKVLLTGSADTGRAVLAELAPRLVPATVELSGCDAVFVRADADLELTVRALRFGLLWNGGATCIAPRRVFVHRSLAVALHDALKDALRTAPVLSVGAVAARQVDALVQDALARGARLAAGGVVTNGGGARDRMAATVLADAAPEMAALQADILAPLLSLVTVAGDDEALELAGRCPYALGATVFGAEPGALALAARIDAGVVTVNDLIVPTVDPRVPFGGRGASGFGVTRGAEGLLELTRTKAVVARRGRWRPHLDPLDPEDGDSYARFFSEAIRQSHGANFSARLAARFRLLRTAARLGRGGPRRGTT